MSNYSHKVIANYVEIFLIRRDLQQFTVLVDIDDWEWIQNYAIIIEPRRQSFYVRIYDKCGIKYYLHNAIMDSKGVDHINENGLDNRKNNLRKATNSQNMHNRVKAQSNSITGIKGVCFVTGKQKYKASVSLNGKGNFLGYYDTAEEAEKAVKLFRSKCVPFSLEARL